jgi:hypothetical protein
MMTRLRTRGWPWFALAALLLFVGAVILSGTPQAVVNSAAGFTFLGACIRQVGLLVRDNPTQAETISRHDIAAGMAGSMAEESGRRRRARRKET